MIIILEDFVKCRADFLGSCLFLLRWRFLGCWCVGVFILLTTHSISVFYFCTLYLYVSCCSWQNNENPYPHFICSFIFWSAYLLSKMIFLFLSLASFQPIQGWSEKNSGEECITRKEKSGASGDVLPFYSSLRFCSISLLPQKETHNVVVGSRVGRTSG